MKKIFTLFTVLLLVTLLFSFSVSAETESESSFSSFFSKIFSFFSSDKLDTPKTGLASAPSFLEKEKSLEQETNFKATPEEKENQIPEELDSYTITFQDEYGRSVTQILYYDKDGELAWVETKTSKRKKVVDKYDELLLDEDIQEITTIEKVKQEPKNEIRFETIDTLHKKTDDFKASVETGKVQETEIRETKQFRDSGLSEATGKAFSDSSSQGSSIVLAIIILLASFLGYGWIKRN